MEMLKVGDWVQATEEITEENFLDAPVWTHALKGAIGHVMEIVSPDCAVVTWERTGTTSESDVSCFKRLGPWDTGRYPVPA